MPTAEPTPPQQLVKLPPARLVQLKKIAEARGLTVVETIERYINREIEAGIIEDSLPGNSIFRDDDVVHVGLPTFALPLLHSQHARELAMAIEAVAQRKHRGLSATLPDGSEVKIANIGPGMRIAYGDKVATMTFAMGRDLARIIRNASK